MSRSPVLRKGQVNIDWSNGRRTWVSLDGKTVCVHDRVPTEPINYTSWHEWAAKYGRKHKQRPCETSGCPVLCWSTEPKKPREESATSLHTTAAVNP